MMKFIVKFIARRNICQSHDFALRRNFYNFNYGIHNKRYKEDIWIQKHVLTSVFANAFKVAKFAKLKDV